MIKTSGKTILELITVCRPMSVCKIDLFGGIKKIRVADIPNIVFFHDKVSILNNIFTTTYEVKKDDGIIQIIFIK